MIVDIFTACHAARATEGATFTIDKAFCSLVIPPPLPRRLQKIKVAIRISFDDAEAGDHVLTLKLMDMDGHCLQQKDEPIHPSKDDDPRNRIYLCVIDLEPFSVKTYGEYRVCLEVDRQEKAYCQLHLSKSPNTPSF
jgi:hypothetical protein